MQKLRLTTQGLIALTLVGAVSMLLAGGEAIGFAVAAGTFQVDSAQVYGNTTLFDGATISTAKASSRLELTNGARLTLGEDSQARIFEKRMTLERGTGELKTPADYRMDARTLRISPLDPSSVARVKLEGPRQVLVAAVNGRVRVMNEAGLLVANVEPGVALLFTPQAAEAGTFKMSGCLLESANGKFFLMDPTQTVELRGSGLSAEANNHVDIAGTAFRSAFLAPAASQVVQVDTGGLKQTAVGGCEESIGKLESSGVKVAKPGQPVRTAAIEYPGSPVAIHAGVGVGPVALSSGNNSTGPGVTSGGGPLAGSSPRTLSSNPLAARGAGRPDPTTGVIPRAGGNPPAGSSSPERCCRPGPGRPDPPTGAIPRAGGNPPAGGSPPSMPSMSP